MSSYYGVCLNCGSGKCGYFGGCEDGEGEKTHILTESQYEETKTRTVIKKAERKKPPQKKRKMLCPYVRNR